jgi:hypothetical protein
MRPSVSSIEKRQIISETAPVVACGFSGAARQRLTTSRGINDITTM